MLIKERYIQTKKPSIERKKAKRGGARERERRESKTFGERSPQFQQESPIFQGKKICFEKKALSSDKRGLQSCWTPDNRVLSFF